MNLISTTSHSKLGLTRVVERIFILPAQVHFPQVTCVDIEWVYYWQILELLQNPIYLGYHPRNEEKFPRVYKIECSCGKCYIGETSRSFHTRIKEHGANIKKERTHTSALAEHSLKTKHRICIEETKILAKEDHLLKRRIREPIEIIKNPNNLNKDKGLEISDIWIPLIRERR